MLLSVWRYVFLMAAKERCATWQRLDDLRISGFFDCLFSLELVHAPPPACLVASNKLPMLAFLNSTRSFPPLNFSGLASAQVLLLPCPLSLNQLFRFAIPSCEFLRPLGINDFGGALCTLAFKLFPAGNASSLGLLL